MKELRISDLASARTGHLDPVGENRLLDAIDLASDHDQVTWLLNDHGKRIAAIVPVSAVDWVYRDE
jgi:hypothetical protein